MTPEERQMLTGLFDRIHAASATPRDPDAEAFIGAAVRAIPTAPYTMAQTILVQEEALRAATERVHQLEAQVVDLQNRGAPAQSQAPAGSFLGGIGKSIFGGAPAPAAAPPPPSPAWGRQAAPQPAPPPAWGGQQAQPGPWGGQPAANQYAPQAAAGGGFLKGALGAAAGVAGGVLLADSIRGMMGGHNSPFGSAFGNPGGERVVNNYYGADSQQAALHDQDVRDDALQDAQDDQRAQDMAQDAAQDAGDYNNASYDDNSGGYSDNSTDV